MQEKKHLALLILPGIISILKSNNIHVQCFYDPMTLFSAELNALAVMNLLL